MRDAGMDRLNPLVEDAVSFLKEFITQQSRLNSLLYLKLVLEPVGRVAYVHVSGERGESYIPVFRVNNEPYIPPSSIHGALRATAEGISKASITKPEGLDQIFLNAHCEPEGDIIRHTCSELGQGYVSLVKSIIENVLADKELYQHFITDEGREELSKAVKGWRDLTTAPRAVEPIIAPLCPICRLFGGPGLKAKLEIVDVTLHTEGIHAVTYASIDRPTSTVRAKHLYTLENLAVKKLRVTVRIKNIAPGSSEAKILSTLLTYLKEIGVSVGGKKSCGEGRFVLNPEQSVGTFIELSKLSNPKQLVHAIVSPDKLMKSKIAEIVKALNTGTPNT